MAKEYETQSESFKTAKTEIETKLTKEIEDDKIGLLPLKPAESWTVTQNENFTKLKTIFDKNGVKASIIYLDNLLSNKKLETVEYYSLKTWVLFKTGTSDAQRKMYKAELESSGQQALIDKWKALP